MPPIAMTGNLGYALTILKLFDRRFYTSAPLLSPLAASLSTQHGRRWHVLQTFTREQQNGCKEG